LGSKKSIEDFCRGLGLIQSLITRFLQQRHTQSGLPNAIQRQRQKNAIEHVKRVADNCTVLFSIFHAPTSFIQRYFPPLTKPASRTFGSTLHLCASTSSPWYLLCSTARFRTASSSAHATKGLWTFACTTSAIGAKTSTTRSTTSPLEASPAWS